MSKVLQVQAANQLDLINNAIHDWWFDVDEIRFDREKATLTMRFVPEEVYRSSRRSSPRDRGKPSKQMYLVARNVLEFRVKDTEKVRFYDLNVLKYDPAKKSLRFSTGVPIEIEARVSDLFIELAEEMGTG